MEIVTALAATVGLFFAGWQLREQTRQKRLNLGQFYIERYWSIDDQLLLATKGASDHRQHRHRYLRLFEDEFDAARLKWLDAEQWTVWHAYLDNPQQAELVADDLAICDPEGQNFVLLRTCLHQRANDGRPHRSKTCAAGPESGPSRLLGLRRRATTPGSLTPANG